MKAAAVVLVALLVLLHPMAAVTVLAVELGAVAVVGCLIIRGLRPLCLPAPRRKP